MRAAGLFVLVALAAAGCGGGSGSGRLSSEDFRKQANAICATYSRKVNALPDPGGYAALARYAASARQALVDSVRELKALKPPDDLQADYSAWLRSTDRALGRVGDLERAAKARNAAAIRKLSASANAEDVRSDEIATRLGIAECAND